MENKKKTIKLGDTFCIKPICFEYYDVNNEGNTKDEDKDYAIFGFLPAADNVSGFDELFDNLPILVEYVGCGKVREESTNQIFNIYTRNKDLLFDNDDHEFKETISYDANDESSEKYDKYVDDAKKFIDLADENSTAIIINSLDDIKEVDDNLRHKYEQFNPHVIGGFVNGIVENGYELWTESKANNRSTIDEIKKSSMSL